MTADTAHDPKRGATYRALLAVVTILGVLIVLAFGALIVGGIMQFTRHRATAAAPAAELVLPGAAAALPPGARITSIETAGNRVVVGVHSQAGDEIDLFDTGDGHLVARIRPQPSTAPK